MGIDMDVIKNTSQMSNQASDYTRRCHLNQNMLSMLIMMSGEK